ncbi:MAG: outer membrane protein transport protein [Granulosicoccus sp.]
MKVQLRIAGITTAAMVVLGSVPAISYATNGFIPHAFSPKDKGLAGAGVAYSQDTLAAGSNPAGMVTLGDRFDFAIDVFSPRRSYEPSGPASAGFGTPTGEFSQTPVENGFPTFSIGPQSIDSDNEAFFVPSFGYNKMLDANSSLGISVYGAGGMNTEYPGGNATLFNPQSGEFVSPPGTFGAGKAGVNLEVLFVGGTYARKINEKHAVGITAIFANSRFSATGLGNFAGFSTDPQNLTNNGTESATGFGIGLGWQGQVTDVLTLGVAYQSKIGMGELDDYAGLFADGGGFDIPSWINAGLAWEITPGRRLVADVQRINYADSNSISNPVATLFPPNFGGDCVPGDGVTPAVGAGCLGGSNGAGFGWDDMTIIKLGYEWTAFRDWTWRVGYSHTDQPIPDSEVVFNILAPAVISDHVTFGFTKPMGSNSEWNFNLMHALNGSVSGTNSFDQGQQVEIEMNQLQVGLGFAKTF